jgi:hypothetical protein
MFLGGAVMCLDGWVMGLGGCRNVPGWVDDKI